MALGAASPIGTRQCRLHGKELPEIHVLRLARITHLAGVQEFFHLRLRGLFRLMLAHAVAPLLPGIVAHECANLPFGKACKFNRRLPCGRISDGGFEFPPVVGVDADGFLSTADRHIELLARTGKERIGALRDQHITDALALG